MIAPPFLVFNLFLGLLWLYLFLRQKSTRVEMLLIGLVAVLFTPVFVTLAEQINGGSFTLLDLVFSFCFAGVAAVIFEVAFGKHYRIGHHARLPFRRPAEHWFAELLLTAVAWSWMTVAFLFVLGMTATQSIIASGLIIGSYILARRRDLFWNAIWSALLMMSVFFLLYAFTVVRTFSAINEPFLLSGPRQALIFFGVMGFVLGPLYEFVRHLKDKR